MTGIDRENISSITQSPASGTRPSAISVQSTTTPPAEPKKTAPHKKTSGELIFDRTVYTGVGFVANEISSMIIADELRYGKGKKFFDKASEVAANLYKKNKADYFGKIITPKAQAANMLEVGALLIGGTLLVVPMKWLEDRKAGLVEKLNHAMDKVRGRNPNDERIKLRDQEVAEVIACQPKQSWTSLLIGRALAVVSNMFILSNTVFAEPRASQIKDWSEDKITKGTVKLDQMLGNKPNSALKKMMGDPAKSFEERRFPRYARILSIETLYTLASSAVLEIASKFMAKKRPLVHDEKLCVDVEKRKCKEMLAVDTTPIQTQSSTRTYRDHIKPKQINTEPPNPAFVQRIAAESEHPLQPGL